MSDEGARYKQIIANLTQLPGGESVFRSASPIKPPPPAPEVEIVDDGWFDQWTWRNCRALIIGFELLIFPWQWRVKLERWDDNSSREWQGWLCLGPLRFSLMADTGNCSSETPWRARFGMTDEQAFRNSCQMQARKASRNKR